MKGARVMNLRPDEGRRKNISRKSVTWSAVRSTPLVEFNMSVVVSNSEPAGKGSEAAGRASEAIGRVSEAAGRALKANRFLRPNSEEEQRIGSWTEL